jgi:thiol-disulfide isomerase/thioredoxin
VALACLIALTGCSSLEGTDGRGYPGGDGGITELAADERDDPVELEGEDLEGKDISLEEFRGQVTVVNVWWSGCGPCRHEAPWLTSVAKEMADQQVEFVGVNIRDSSPDNGLSFVREFDIPFRSIYDPTGVAMLAFNGDVPPHAVPTTLVLDREGRIAARVLGPLPSEITLRNLVEKVVAEDG